MKRKKKKNDRGTQERNSTVYVEGSKKFGVTRVKSLRGKGAGRKHTWKGRQEPPEERQYLHV
jgi:hypothetical protein